MSKRKAYGLIIVLLLSSILSGCTASDVKEELLEVIYDALPFPIKKSLCFGSTVLNAAFDGTINGSFSEALDMANLYGQVIEVDMPDSASTIDSASSVASSTLKHASYSALKTTGPYGVAAAITIKVIDVGGNMACAILDEEVNDELWYNYTYNLAQFAADSNQLHDLAFKSNARILDVVTGARSGNTVEFTLTLLANATQECIESCGDDGTSMLFEAENGLTTPFGTVRDIEMALDDDMDSYAFAAAFLCPSLNSPIEYCIDNGSSVLRIPHDFAPNQRPSIQFDATLVCPSEEDFCSRDSVTIDAYLCGDSGICSSPKSVYDCSGCELQMEWDQSATQVMFVLRLSNSHVDNAASMKIYHIESSSN